jgi:hypothetical protein
MSSESVSNLREWANNRCLSADFEGLFKKDGPPKPLMPDGQPQRMRRRITRPNGN